MHLPKFRRLLALANIAEGTHADGNITLKADAAMAVRHLLVKEGSDINHVAVCTAQTDRPIGVVNDEADAAEDFVNVQLFGAVKGTILMVAGAAITAGDEVTASSDGDYDGYVTTAPTSGAGTYYIVGRAMNAATAAGDLVEVQPYFYRHVIHS